MRRFSVLLLVLTFGAAAQETAAVRGIVVDRATGVPISRVHVALLFQEPGKGSTAIYGAMSDEAGRFSISSIRPQAYFVFPQRAGYLPAPLKIGGARLAVLNLKAGQQIDDYRVEMTRRALISGRVLDSSGDPLMNAMVSAEPASGDGLPLSFLGTGIGSASTDDRGFYRITVPPGNLSCESGAEAGHGIRGAAGDSHRRREVRHPPVTWYAGSVETRPGNESAGIDIRVGFQPLLEISGHVTGMTAGEPVFIGVHARNERRDTMLRLQPRPDSSFSLKQQEPGTYTLYAESQGLRSAPVKLELSESSVSDLELALQHGTDVTGLVTIRADWVRLEPMLTGIDWSQPAPEAPVTREGRFQFTALAPQRYRVLVISRAEDIYVENVRLGEAVIAGSIVDLSKAASAVTLKISVSTRAARISGIVEEGTSLAKVFLVADGDDSFESRQQANVGTDGSYSFHGIAPGKYRLFAFDHLAVAGEWLGGPLPPPERRPSAEVIEVKEGDRITKDLKLEALDARKP